MNEPVENTAEQDACSHNDLITIEWTMPGQVKGDTVKYPSFNYYIECVDCGTKFALEEAIVLVNNKLNELVQRMNSQDAFGL